MKNSVRTVSFIRVGSIGVAEISNPPVNAINRAIRVELLEVLEQAIADPAVAAILIVSTGKVFMAGVDISEFSRPITGPSLQALEDAIETAPKPVIVAIQGQALGGGVELAAACHYRIAAADATLRLPEITLGLIPGAGGTQRLPRLIGSKLALDMMLGSEPVSADAALSRGLVDEVIATDLRTAAMAFVGRVLSEARGPRPTRAMDVRDRLDAVSTAASLKKHARLAKGLKAPQLIIKAIEAAALPFAQGMAVEKRLADESLSLRESQALRHLFFADRAGGKTPGAPVEATLPALRTAAVIGAGTMGSGIALAFADAAVSVVLIDNANGLARGLDIIHTNYASSVKRGRIDQSDANLRSSRIRTSTILEDAGEADVVVEAVFEDLDVKKAVLSALDKIMPADKLIASNTSTLSITELGRFTDHPERVAGLHFFSPAHIMKLLEIVRGEDTTPRMLAVALQVSRILKKTCVVANDGFGFIGNRMMLDGYFRESEQLLLEGATPVQVDTALERFGFAMGPQRVSDLGGTDVGTKAREQLYKRQSRPDPYFVIADALTRLGRLGQKSGAGFYRYDAGGREALHDPEVETLIQRLAAERGIVRRAIAAEEIVERCILSLILMGARVLDEGIAMRAADIDVVWTSGYGFPRYLGGPMFYADTLGLAHVAERIRHYHELYGHYWKPTALIERLATEKKTFQQLDEERR